MKTPSRTLKVALLVALVSTVTAATVVQAGPGNGQERVALCHIAGEGRLQLISVPAPTVPVHLAHGDDSPLTFYADSDGDGFGDPAEFIEACTQPEGYVADSTDCYDQNVLAHPDQGYFFAIERGDGSFDYNCDGMETLQLPATYSGCGTCAPLVCCDFEEGWLGDIPACGGVDKWAVNCKQPECTIAWSFHLQMCR